MKKIIQKNDGDSLRARLEQWDICQMLKGNQTKSRKFETHPEFEILKRIPWEGMLTIRIENDSYATDNAAAESRRDKLVGLFMDNLIRHHWRKRHKDVLWISVIEFGDSGIAHVHILFSFEPLREKGNPTPDLGFVQVAASDSLEHICGLLGCPIGAVEVHFELKFDNEGLASYVCKVEPGRDYKHFVWSAGGDRWITVLTNREESFEGKEVDQ